MQNEKYIEFANTSTVEVLALGSIEVGLAQNDKRAKTYTKEENGQKFEYLIEFPNLTIEEMSKLNGSKAATYNDTGHIPFGCIVDPWTEKEMTRLPTLSVGKIIEAAKEARKQLVKEHGPGLDRAQIKAVTAAEQEVLALTEATEFGKAEAALAKVEKGLKDAQLLTDRVTAARAQMMAKAEEALKSAIEACDLDAATGKKALTALLPKLKGTGLEKQAADKLKELASPAG